MSMAARDLTPVARPRAYLSGFGLLILILSDVHQATGTADDLERDFHLAGLPQHPYQVYRGRRTTR